jgi:STE24 endopeptidase
MNEDKASRYHRLKRRARIATGGLSAALLAALVASGGAAWLRDRALSLSRLVAPAAAPWVAVAAYVTFLFLLAEALTLPLSAYRGFVLDRRYGLGRQTWAQWLRDSAKASAVGLVLAIGAAEVIYGALRPWPGWWWAPVTVVFALFTALLAFAAPVVLLPLFFRFTPVERDLLRERLLQLARRAGTRVLGVYEWKLGDKSRAANAALVGLGGTRRIVISDTLLSEYSDEEIEVVLAHELAHHVHGDIRSMILADAVVTLVTLLACHAALVLAGPLVGLRSRDDLAGLPLLLLVAGVVSLLTVPFVNAWSRRHERRADQYALDLTANPEAFISAMKRLGAQNLADEYPSRLVEWLFHSHPPLPRRIQAAREWVPGAPGASANRG